MLSNNETLSKTISYLRLPLIVSVVFIHTSLEKVNVNGNLLVAEDLFPLHNILQHLISREIGSISVPLFFFFSGFLFFKNTDFNFDSFKKKLNKRFHTLLIPYIFWNFLVLILYYLAQTFFPSMISGANKLVREYNIFDYFCAFWSYEENMPISYQFWFIRDLIVVVICSPIVYLIIRKLNVLGVVLLGILWCLGMVFPITGFSCVAFFFFTFGAYFAINQRNFIVDFKPLRLSFTFFYILLVMVDTYLWYYQNAYFYFIHKIGILIGLITIITWTAYGIQKKILKSSALLTGSSFFIYAYHGLPIMLLVKIWVNLMCPVTELTMVLGYILIPCIIVGVGIGIYILMVKLFPRFLGFITGGR